MDICLDPEFLRILYGIKEVLNLVYIAVPVGLIVMLSIDFGKLVVSPDEGQKQKTIPKIINKLIAGIVVFFVATIVNVIFSIGYEVESDYGVCWENANLEKIDDLKIERAAEAIEKAFSDPTRQKYNTAKYFVEEIVDNERKAEFEVQLKEIEKIVIATEAVDEAERITSNEHYNSSDQFDGIRFEEIAYLDGSSGDVYVTNSPPSPSTVFTHHGDKISSVDFQAAYDGAGNSLGIWPKHIQYERSVVVENEYNGMIWSLTPSNGIYTFVYHHNGIDILAQFGEPIYAPVSGNLRYSEWGHTRNNGSDETAYSVTIYPDEPINHNGNIVSTIYYTHMSGIVQYCPDGSCNERVEKGDLIGFVGNATGDGSSYGWAPHLHATLYDKVYDYGLTTTETEALYNISSGVAREAGK